MNYHDKGHIKDFLVKDTDIILGMPACKRGNDPRQMEARQSGDESDRSTQCISGTVNERHFFFATLPPKKSGREKREKFPV